MEFQTFKIGDLAKVQGGFAFKSADFKDTGIPVLKITNVQDRKIELNNLSHVDPNIVAGLERFFVKSGDVLISMTGNGPQTDTALVGRTARYNGPDDTFLLNQRVGRFLVNDDLVRKRYLYYWISRPEINRELALRSTGSANQANINASTIENFEISIPDLATQDKILKILGDIDDKIETNIQISETLESMAKAIFKEWFIDFGPVKAKAEGRKPFGMDDETASLFPDRFKESELGLLPLGWNYTDIDSATELIIDHRGKTPLKLGGEWSNSGYQAISAKNIKANRLVNLEQRYVDESLYQRWMKDPIKSGDILMTSEAPMGEMYFVTAETDFVLSQRVYGIRAKSNFTSEFLYFWLDSDSARADMAGRSTGTTVTGIRQSELRKVSVLQPSSNIQKAFSSVASPLLAKVTQNEVETKLLIQTRDLLLPKLISGEIDLKELDDAFL